MKYCCCTQILACVWSWLEPQAPASISLEKSRMDQFLEDMANGVATATGYRNLYMGGRSVKPGNLPSRDGFLDRSSHVLYTKAETSFWIHFPIKHPGSFPLDVRYFELTRVQSWPIYFLLFFLTVSLSWLLLYMNMRTIFTHSLYQTEIKWVSVTQSSLYNITSRSSQVTSERANKSKAFYLKVYSMGFSSGYSVIVPCRELPVPLCLSHWKVLQEMYASVHSSSATIWVGFWVLLVWGESTWT